MCSFVMKFTLEAHPKSRYTNTNDHQRRIRSHGGMYVRRWVTLSVLLTALFGVCVLMPRQNIAVMANSRGFETLVIDPGHGGADGGAVSAIGRKESDINLSVALKTRDLAVLLGIPCAMTREDDSALDEGVGTLSQRKASDLKHRAEIVNDAANALLVSIHQNHFPQAKYHGAQVFYAKTDGSDDLARLMQQLLRVSLDTTNNRAVKPCSGVYLMEHIHCPAVLVECGFLSNAAEEEKLHNSDYQKKIAAAVVAAVSQYKSEANGIAQV